MKRLAMMLFLCCAATACGFHPMYGKRPNDNPALALAGVRIDPIPTRYGQLLHENLEDSLNPGGAVPPNPVYRLSATITTTTSGLDISRNGTVSFYDVLIDSTYFLYRIADGKQITTGRVHYVSSYNNVINDYFSTYVAADDAIQRGIVEMSQDFRLRLSPYLVQDTTAKPPAAGAPPAPAARERLPAL